VSQSTGGQAGKRVPFRLTDARAARTAGLRATPEGRWDCNGTSLTLGDIRFTLLRLHLMTWGPRPAAAGLLSPVCGSGGANYQWRNAEDQVAHQIEPEA